MTSVSYNISPEIVFPPHILRMAKIAKQKSRINAKAKGEQNQGEMAQPPHLKLKRKPGARKGNRNALKHGLYSSALIGMKRRVSCTVAELKHAAAQVRFQAAMMDAETAFKPRAAAPVRSLPVPPR
jgi:hypothetical protein